MANFHCPNCGRQSLVPEREVHTFMCEACWGRFVIGVLTTPPEMKMWTLDEIANRPNLVDLILDKVQAIHKQKEVPL